MSNTSSETNRVIILGSSLVETDDIWNISPEGMSRLDRFLDYFHENRMLFRSNQALVVCSGGYAGLAKNQAQRESDKSEASFYADYLVQNEVPAGIVEKEERSHSTTTNYIFAQDLGLINPGMFTPSEPLGNVSNWLHLQRAFYSAKKLGYDRDDLLPITSHAPGSTLQLGKRLVTEIVAHSLTRAAYVGAHGREELLQREQMLARLLRRSEITDKGPSTR